MASIETWPVKARMKEALLFFARVQGNNTGAVVVQRARGITITRTGVGTYQATADSNSACPALYSAHVQPMGTTAFQTMITAFSEANNTINISTFRLSNAAAYELTSNDQLWVTAIKGNTVVP